MYVGFNLDLETDKLKFKDGEPIFEDSRSYNEGKSIYEENKEQVKREFDKFIDIDGTIDGTAMQNNWFPQMNTDIFISHSHKDQEYAIYLAGWLKEKFGLNAFIDSCVWGYADELLKKIDDNYCKNPGETTYSYEKRNYSTSHVHMMLSNALSMMIDKSECVFFINTPNSISLQEGINKTKSPWIYLEIAMTKLIRKKEPVRKEYYLKKAYEFAEKYDLVINYEVEIDHLSKVTIDDLEAWAKHYKNENKNGTHPLDILYGRYNLITFNKLIKEGQ